MLLQTPVIALLCSTLWAVASCNSSDWWLISLPSSPESVVDPNNYKSYCKRLPYLVKRQKEICDLDFNVLQTISRGARIGVDECQHQFQNSRWNCSSKETTNSSNFGGILSSQNRERSYLYSVSAAAVAYIITKECALGHLPECGCDSRIKSRDTRGKWEWGGCSEDIRFGSHFSKDFVDSAEDPTTPQGTVNLHNNEAGRRVIRANMDLVCKCHGVSGSCTIRICWRKMKPFRAIGDALVKKFDAATKVRALDASAGRIKLRPTKRDVKKPGKRDLVYMDDSPDFCQASERTGVLGTRGRTCNATSYGMDGCRLLCCGRGYSTVVREVTEKCNCKFVWCCRVDCDKCSKRVEQTFCN